jgi:hypothetical protein
MGCGRSRSSYENTMVHYWNSLPIINISTNQYVSFIKEHYIKGEEEKLNKLILNEYLTTLDLDIHSIMIIPDLWSKNKNNYQFYFISLVFLCTKDLNHNSLVLSLSQLIEIFGLGNHLHNESDKRLVDYDFFYNLISFYFDMVSLFGVERLSETTKNAKEFRQIMSEYFQISIQKKLLEKFFENSKIKLENVEGIYLENLLERNFKLLDNNEIRDLLVDLKILDDVNLKTKEVLKNEGILKKNSQVE